MIDSELIRRLNRSDHTAFTEIYNLLCGRVYRTVIYLLKDPVIARDVVQDLFMTLWEHRTSISPDRNLEGYVAVVARNLCYKHFERAQSRLSAAVDDELADTLASDSDAASGIETSSLEDHIVTLLRSQPEMRRRVFMMSRFDNLSHAEIARELGISERTVEAHIYQVIKALKSQLGYMILITLTRLTT